MSFWEKFHRENWLPRVPTVIRGAGGRFTDEQVLRAIQEFQRSRDAGDETFRFMFSLGDKAKAAPGALSRVLRKEATDMDALEANIARAFPKKPFGIMVNNFQSLDTELYRGVTGFLRDAHPYIEFPIAIKTVDLFYGNYAASFLGLHKDTQDIFAFVTRGKKRMLFWPFDYFLKKVPGISAAARYFQVQVPVDYRKYKKDAIVLEAGPGDIIYWSSDYWHIAEGKLGDFSTMLSLGLFRPDFVDPAQADELTRFHAKLRQGGASLHSDDVTDVNAEGGAKRLNWMTGFGFTVGGPVTKNARARGEIAKVPESLLLWTDDGKRLTVSCNGHLQRFPRTKDAVELLERLAAGERVPAPRLSLVNWLARVQALC